MSSDNTDKSKVETSDVRLIYDGLIFLLKVFENLWYMVYIIGIYVHIMYALNLNIFRCNDINTIEIYSIHIND